MLATDQYGPHPRPLRHRRQQDRRRRGGGAPRFRRQGTARKFARCRRHADPHRGRERRAAADPHRRRRLAACCATTRCWRSSGTPPASCSDVKDLLSIATLGLSRRGAAVHRLGVAPAARNPLRGRDHRHARRNRRRQDAALRRVSPRRPAPSSPCATCSSTFRRARNFCAPTRPSWRTSRRW